jgi:ribosomal protein S26
MAHGIYSGIPRWQRAGYKPKMQCDRCGFRSPHKEVFRVFHVDGNLDNCRHSNLKTACANCRAVLSKEGVQWRQGDLIADY